MIIYTILLALLNLKIVEPVQIKQVSELEKSNEFWIKNGIDKINSKINDKPIRGVAKNIILAIGDGMGISTLTSTRIYKNQQMINKHMPDENLYFENFPNVGLSKTYSVDKYVPDSAATATAILTGIKINSRVIGLSSKVLHKNCSSYTFNSDELVNIAEMFFKQGKSVGFVTTSSIVDATPAAMYAHIPARSWQNAVPIGCPVKDIALQFIEKCERFHVVMGGGRRHFLTKDNRDPEYPYKNGDRQDGRNLLKKWSQKMEGKWKDKAKFIWNSGQLNDTDTKSIKYLFGLFEYDNMKYEDERVDDPTLETMTEKAIEILSQNPNGYFLLVEGAKIDKAHHQNKAFRAILETLELEKAVARASELVNPSNTLVIVTADHSHTLTLGSYLNRNVDITVMSSELLNESIDKKGHTFLLYSNGPGYKNPRENITQNTKFTPDSSYNSGVPIQKATHAGEEVSVYAKGPWGHLLKDIYEQSFIGHVMMYASCNGNFKDRTGCFASHSAIHKHMIYNFVFILMFLHNIY